MIKLTINKFENSRIQIIFNQPKAPTHGLFIIHGMAEHAHRYERFMTVLESHNILALAIDLRGHGASLREGQQVGILHKDDSFEAILKDIHTWVTSTQLKYPHVSFTLLGHSMGSQFARAYAKAYPGQVDRMIWMGMLPYFSPLKIRLIRSIAFGVALFYPKDKRNKVLSGLLNHPLEKHHPGGAFSWLSVNQENVKAYRADPLSGYPYNSIFYRWFFKLIQAINQPSSFHQTKLKHVYVIAGTEDPVIGSEKALKNLMRKYQDQNPSLEVAYYFVPQARHEVLHEGIEMVDQWLMEVITHER